MWIPHNRLVPVMPTILPDVVRVEYEKVRESLSGFFLRDVLQTYCTCEFVDTHSPLSAARPRARFSSAAFSYSNSDYNVALFGLETERSCPVEPSWVLDRWTVGSLLQRITSCLMYVCKSFFSRPYQV